MADRTIYETPKAAGGVSAVELADGSRVYRKQLVKFGSYVDPRDSKKKMVLDRPWAERLLSNFKNHVLNKVPVVDGHPRTEMLSSEELVQKTRGWLNGASIEDDGIYGELEIKTPETAKGIDQNLIDDVSISYDNDYMDKSSGENVGPTLLHVGLVNDPYLKGMKPFQALSDRTNVIMLSESEEPSMSKLKNEHEYPATVKVDGKDVVLQPGAEVDVPDDQLEAVTKQLTEATKPEPEPTPEPKPDPQPKPEPTVPKPENEPSDVEKELEATKKELAEKNKQLALSEAEKNYTELLNDGKIIPAQKPSFIALSTAEVGGAITLSDGATKSLPELLTELFKVGPKRINFGEGGADGGEAEKTPYDELSAEEKAANERLGVTPEQYNEANGGKVTKKEDK